MGLWNKSYQHAEQWQTKRHDTVCAQLHFNICKEIGVKLDKERWYGHVLKLLETGHKGKVAILWDQQVQSDRSIPNNKPDIKIRENKKGTCMSIDVFRGDEDVFKREAEIFKIQRPHNRNSRAC